MPAKITTSEILSKEESRNAPFLEAFFVTRATLPSTMSKNPEIKRSTPPMTGAKTNQKESVDGS